MESPPDQDFNPYASPKAEVPADGSGPNSSKPLGAGEVIQIEGALSPKDLYHANGLVNKATPQTSIGCALVALFALFLPCLLLLSGLGFGWAAAWTVLLLVPTGALAYVGLRQTRRIHRCWRQQRGICAWQRIEITDSQLKQQTDTGLAVYQWTAFSQYTSSKRVVLLHFDPPGAMFYDPPLGFIVIPRAFFDDEADWDRFVALVRHRLPKKYGKRPSGQDPLAAAEMDETTTRAET